MKPCPTLLLLTVLFAAAGCNGPAHPEQDGRAWMQQHGYTAEQIDAVVAGRPLAPALVTRARASGSADVRFLVARNPALTPDQLARFIDESDDYARSGAAWNPSLTQAQMETLAQDPSHTVYCGLARNPAVPAAILLKLRRERQLELTWFALNPACPPVLVAEIEASADEQAKHYLAMTRRIEAARTGAAAPATSAPPAP